uniref:Putative ovule protein n=1 Tax=Solanum chacoense TaxID=4108 RepID=A0A0V0H3W1_SOLCH
MEKNSIRNRSINGEDSSMKSLGNKPINEKDPIIEMGCSTLLNSCFNREHQNFASVHNSDEARRRWWQS